MTGVWATGDVLTATRLNQGMYMVLDDHKAAGAESSYTKSSVSWDLITTYRELLIRFNCNQTSASDTLGCQVNGQITGYISTIISTANTPSGPTAANGPTTYINLASTTLMRAASVGAMGWIKLFAFHTNSFDYVFFRVWAMGGDGTKTEETYGMIGAINPITSIKFYLVGASTWAINSEFVTTALSM